MGGESYDAQSPWSPTQRETYHDRPRFTGFEHLLFYVHVGKFLRTHGLQPQELHLVARTTTVSSILYATPAWGGREGEGDRLRLERLIARMRRRGYLPSNFLNIVCLSLAKEADRRLFKSIIQCQTQVLRHLFIDKPTSTRSLRVKGLGRIISSCPLKTIEILCLFAKWLF